MTPLLIVVAAIAVLGVEPPEGSRTSQRTGAVVATPILGWLQHRSGRNAA